MCPDWQEEGIARRKRFQPKHRVRLVRIALRRPAETERGASGVRTARDIEIARRGEAVQGGTERPHTQRRPQPQRSREKEVVLKSRNPGELSARAEPVYSTEVG